MSTQSTPAMPTHRGFSSKAREILLDPPGTSTMQQQQAKLGNIQESPSRVTPLRRLSGFAKVESEGELRRAILNGCAIFRRSDSQSTQKSNLSTKSSPIRESEFDDLDDFSKVQKLPKVHKLIGEIGKTKSASDVTRKNTVIKTFQQENILKLPSVDSDLEKATRYRKIVQREESFSSVGSFSDVFDGQAARKSTYHMK